MNKQKIVGNLTFETKLQARDYFRALFQRVGAGKVPRGQDHHDLNELVSCHPDAETKIGSGISYYRIVRAPRGPELSIEINRTDKSRIDISYIKCLNGRPKHRSIVKRALRDAVDADINALRQQIFHRRLDKHGKLRCEQTGHRISPTEGSIDHIGPLTFAVIVEAWITYRALDLDTLAIAPKADHAYREALADPELTEDFRAFHARIARLRFIKSSLNTQGSVDYVLPQSFHRIAQAEVSEEPDEITIG